MCGVFGIVSAVSVAQADFDRLGELNKARGNLAFGGLVARWENGRFHPAPFHHNTPFDSRLVSLHNARLVLSHIRAPTGGQSNDPTEIHPYETADLWLAHNGLLLNHEQFSQWRILPHSSVDSQVIIGGIQWHLTNGRSLLAAICQTVEQLEGQQACWLWHKPTQQIYLWRVMSPIYLDQTATTLLFSSVRPSADATLMPEGEIWRIDPLNCHIERAATFTFYNPYYIPRKGDNYVHN